MGRLHKPAKLKMAEGDRAGDGVHKLDEKLAMELKGEQGAPDCPEHLTGMARIAYLTWANDLVNMGLDCRQDGIMLEGAAQAYAKAVEADKLVAKHGILIIEKVKNKKGKIISRTFKKNPACTASHEAWMRVKTFASEFGLSPVSRTRLSTEKKDPVAPAVEAEFS